VLIPLAVPNLGPREADYAAQAITSGWVGPDGPFVERFEDAVAGVTGRRWAVATITGSAALHVSAYVLWGFRPWTGHRRAAFPAMRNVFALMNSGFRPQEIPGGVNHDIAIYENDYDDDIGLWTLADRAPAIGEPPADAHLECYSFAANKTVTCGHGGAVVGDDPVLLKEVREAVRQGYGLPGLFNYRMANINAAIGCAQIERLDELKASKRSIWQRYADAGLPMVQRGASRWMSTLNAPAALAQQLADEDIEARHEPSGVSIPCSTGLSESDQAKVIEACLALLR